MPIFLENMHGVYYRDYYIPPRSSDLKILIFQLMLEKKYGNSMNCITSKASYFHFIIALQWVKIVSEMPVPSSPEK